MVKYSLYKEDGTTVGEYDLEELQDYKSENYYVKDGDEKVLVGNFLKQKREDNFDPDKTTFFQKIKKEKLKIDELPDSIEEKSPEPAPAQKREIDDLEIALNEKKDQGSEDDFKNDLSDFDSQNQKNNDEAPFEFREFKIDNKNTVIEEFNYEELEKNYQDNHPNNSIELILKKKLDSEKKIEAEQPDDGKTRIVNYKPQPSSDKTRIIPLTPSAMVEVENLRKERELKENPVPVEPEPEEVEEKTDYHGATVVAKIGKYLPKLYKKSKKVESIFERKEKEQEEEEKELLEANKGKEEELEVESTTVYVKKGMKPIVAFAFLAIIGFLVFDDQGKEKAEFEPVFAKIAFPTPYELENAKKAAQFRKKGLELYGKKTYKAKIFAAGLFKQSMEHKFEGNPALGDLILTYSELLDNVRDPLLSGQKLFQLVKIGKIKLLSDVKVVSGTANFYSFFEKHDAAINIIENFLRTKKAPTPKLFAIYLKVLIKGGKLVTARKVYEKLQSVKKKNFEVHSALIQFLMLDDNYEEAKKVAENALTKYGRSVRLQLDYAKILLTFQLFPQLSKTLKIIKALNYEDNPNYYAKYLEYIGMLNAVQGKYDLAATIFQKALKINESDELRSRISQLELGGDKQIRSLILESKILEIIKKSQLLADEKKFDQALNVAIEGVDLDPQSIPARLNLANLQIDQGFFNRAIGTLDALLTKYPQNRKITFSLVNAYLESFKLNEAKSKLARMVDTRLGNTHEFAFYFGKYYNSTGSLGLTYKWLIEAINRNPLDDKSYYFLAQALLVRRQYGRGKSFLLKAIDLDPQNIEYKSLYAKILYELDGPETSIGYLRDVLIDFPDNPRLLSDIAIYYFRSGQIKNFEAQKAMIVKMPKKDPALYRLLIQSSKLEENFEKVIESYRDLIRLSPGDIRARMEFSEYLIDQNKYNLAIDELTNIKGRLETYPRLYYLIARAYFLKGNLVEAEKAANKEVAYNPSLDAGYTLLGKVFAKKGEVNPAIQNLRKALSLNRKSVDALMSLAFIRYSQHHLDEALNLYLRAQKQQPDNPLIHKQLGYIYRAQGQSKLAIEKFQVYLDLDPTSSDQDKIKGIMSELR